MRRVVLLLAVAAAAVTYTGSARADGDPASDYLLTQQVFFPYDAPIPKARRAQLSSTVAAANKAGYKIRVALISSSYDLGSVTALWLKPRIYARFLAAEVSFVYKGKLLIVMPNGFGFNDPHHSPAGAYAGLANVPIGAGGPGLADAAQTAVLRLAGAAGIHVTTVAATTVAAAPQSNTGHDRLVIIAAALGAILLAAAARFLLRRRRTT
ncbi:MAG: hypothetical protein ACRDL2_07175 [Gaiellaceae bacterium]